MVDLVIDVILPFAVSYLANCSPSIKNFVEFNKSLDARLSVCYDRAVKHWPCDAFRERYKGKGITHLEGLKAFIAGDLSKLRDTEVRDLVGRWVLEMRKDKQCTDYIREIKLDKLITTTSFNSEILSQIQRSISQLSSVPEKLDGVIDLNEKLSHKIGALKDEIIKEIRQNQNVSSYSQVEDVNDLILLNDYFSGMRVDDCPEDIKSDVEKLRGDSLWVDVEREGTVIETLQERGVLIVKGAGGRGKSILCLQVGYRLFKKGYLVYITHKTWDWKVIKKSISSIDSSKKSIIIMENAHLLSQSLYDFLEDAKGICASQKEHNEIHNTLFLLNLRPTVEGGGALFPDTLDESDFLDLMQPDVQESRAKGLINHLVEYYHLNVDDLYVNHVPLSETIELNLKTLSIYFAIYTDTYNRSNDITESQVLHIFTRNFNLHNASKTQIKALWVLGALGCFDAPTDSFFLTEREVTALRKYRDQGLCYQENSCFYLSHSTEAYNLCKALCLLSYGHSPRDEEFVEHVTEVIINYYRKIVKKPLLLLGKRRDVEVNFVKPVLWSLNENDGLDALFGFFRDPMICNEIISKISPSFIIKALYKDDNDSSSLSRLKIYVDNIEWIRDHLFDLGYSNLHLLFLVLRSNFKYEFRMIDDMFGDREVLESFVNEYAAELQKPVNGADSFSREIKWRIAENKRLDDSYSLLIRSKNQCDSIVNGCTLRIKGIFHALLYNEITPEIAEDEVNGIIEDVRFMVRQNPGVCSADKLSVFITKTASVAASYHELIICDEYFQNDVTSRLEQTIITQGDMYLFGKFYHNDEMKKLIESYILTSSEMNKNTMLAWLEEVRKNNQGKPFIKGSLADKVELMISS